jgi:hypothetical protein
LLVGYSVAERVTGRFEVMLAKSVAHRIKLHGPAASGLPSGTPAQTVIGKSVFVTLGGGTSKLKIRFSKSVAAQLEQLHSVSLLVRLVLRNAKGGTQTILTPVKLSR